MLKVTYIVLFISLWLTEQESKSHPCQVNKQSQSEKVSVYRAIGHQGNFAGKVIGV